MKKNQILCIVYIFLCVFFTPNLSFSSPSSKEDLWLLSISGGGVRGRIPLAILEEIEKEVGQPIHKLFDAIAGTSTGSLVGLGLVATHNNYKAIYSAEQVGSFYEKYSSLIFKKKPFGSSCSDLVTAFKKGIAFTGPMYEAKNLKKVLKELVGDMAMSKSLCRLFITAYDSSNEEPILFDSHEEAHQSVLLRKAARASCAAPTCFSPSSFYIPGEEKKRSLIDGCMYALDPTEVVFHKLHQEYPQRRIRIVSLQTGIKPNALSHEDARDMGSIGFAPWLIESLLKNQKVQVYKNLSLILPENDYFYFDAPIEIGHTNLDDARADNLAYLRQVGINMTQNDPRFAELIDIFKARFS